MHGYARIHFAFEPSRDLLTTRTNKIFPAANTKIWKNIDNPSPFYFVHSYRINFFEQDAIISKTFYGEDFVSFIEKKNFYGAQFHSEKSHKAGLKLLSNFFREI